MLDPGDVAEWIAEHVSDGSRVGVSVAGTWGRGVGVVTGVALAAPDGVAAYLDPEQLTEEDERALVAWLAEDKHPKALHDVKGPWLAFAERGWPLNGVTSDTALAAYLANVSASASAQLDSLQHQHDHLLAQANEYEQLADHAALQKAGARPRLVLGPWVHTSPPGLAAGMREALAAFDRAFHQEDGRAVRAATTEAARLLRLEGQVGAIVPGAYADLLVVDGNPLDDLSLLTRPDASLSAIAKAGQIVRDRLAV